MCRKSDCLQKRYHFQEAGLLHKTSLNSFCVWKVLFTRPNAKLCALTARLSPGQSWLFPGWFSMESHQDCGVRCQACGAEGYTVHIIHSCCSCSWAKSDFIHVSRVTQDHFHTVSFNYTAPFVKRCHFHWQSVPVSVRESCQIVLFFFKLCCQNFADFFQKSEILN